MAINVRSTSNIDRKIDAVGACSVEPDSCTTAKQHEPFNQPLSMAISACGISTGNEAIGVPADRCLDSTQV
jgi:hypothetical protein